jgi:LDH2 family malate/lactate/ureidoglycolate dehydrogenase
VFQKEYEVANITVKVADLVNKSVQMLCDAGVPVKDAQSVVETLLDAEVAGVETHGFMRLTSYVERIKLGFISPVSNVSVKEVGDHMFLVNGGSSLGQIVTLKALDVCLKEVRKGGFSLAAIGNSNHFGTVGYYTRLTAKEGYIAFLASNASATMPPYGSIENLLGTNPFAVSFPAGKYNNFTIDIAMTNVAKGKIRLYEKRGKEIPLGWAMDTNGNDTTDPVAALAGGLLPMGNHKGYGLGVVVDMLCGILTDSNLGFEIESMFKTTRVANIGHFMVLLDISRFIPLAAFEKRVEQWFDKIKAAKLRPGFEEVLIPGEPEIRKVALKGETIDVLDKTIASIM